MPQSQWTGDTLKHLVHAMTRRESGSKAPIAEAMAGTPGSGEPVIHAGPLEPSVKLDRLRVQGPSISPLPVPGPRRTQAEPVQATTGVRAGSRVALPERPAAAQAQPTDTLGHWYEAALCAQLAEAGIATLGDLVEASLQGRRWWGAMPGFGPRRAAKLVQAVEALLAN